MKPILIIFGTRPEAIKVIPVYLALRALNKNVLLCSSGQHSELLEQVYCSFSIKPDIDFRLMSECENIETFSSKFLTKLSIYLDTTKPSVVLVHGDTTTSFIAAYTSFLKKIPVAHIEAGLRTFNTNSPFPEEANRQATRIFSTLHFAPTEKSFENLVNEYVNPANILVTGNTVVDAVKIIQNRLSTFVCHNDRINEMLQFSQRILITSHRRENQGSYLLNIIEAINELSIEFPSVCFFWPTHPSPNVGAIVNKRISKNKNIIIVPPLEYLEFSYVITQSYCIISDSGGLQEEAPSYNKPILILRDSTERPEVLASGSGKLIGTEKQSIILNVRKLLTDKQHYETMINNENPYGDGHASFKISKKIISFI